MLSRRNGTTREPRTEPHRAAIRTNSVFAITRGMIHRNRKHRSVGRNCTFFLQLRTELSAAGCIPRMRFPRSEKFGRYRRSNFSWRCDAPRFVVGKLPRKVIGNFSRTNVFLRPNLDPLGSNPLPRFSPSKLHRSYPSETRPAEIIRCSVSFRAVSTTV